MGCTEVLCNLGTIDAVCGYMHVGKGFAPFNIVPVVDPMDNTALNELNTCSQNLNTRDR